MTKTFFKMHWLYLKRSAWHYVLIACTILVTGILGFLFGYDQINYRFAYNFFLYSLFTILGLMIPIFTVIMTSKVFHFAKTNNIDYVLYSKPISRKRMYYTNLLISMVFSLIYTFFAYIGIFCVSVGIVVQIKTTNYQKFLIILKNLGAYILYSLLFVLLFSSITAACSAKLGPKSTSGLILGSFIGVGVVFNIVNQVVVQRQISGYDFASKKINDDIVESNSNQENRVKNLIFINKNDVNSNLDNLKLSIGTISSIFDIKQLNNNLFNKLIGLGKDDFESERFSQGSTLYYPRKLNDKKIREHLLKNFLSVYSFSYDPNNNPKMSLNNLLDIKYFYWNEAYVVASQLFKNISFDLDESAAIENALRTHEPFFFESFTNKKQYIENLEIFNFTNNELTKIKNLSTKLEEHIKNNPNNDPYPIFGDEISSFIKDYIDRVTTAVVNKLFPLIKFDLDENSDKYKNFIAQLKKKYAPAYWDWINDWDEQFKVVSEKFREKKPIEFFQEVSKLTNSDTFKRNLDRISVIAMANLIKNILSSKDKEISKNLLGILYYLDSKVVLNSKVSQVVKEFYNLIDIDNKDTLSEIKEYISVNYYPWYITVIIFIGFALMSIFVGKKLFDKQSFNA